MNAGLTNDVAAGVDEAAGTPKRVEHHEVVIVGGGTGGITVAARLTKGWGKKPDVVVIDPSDDHYYQPAWTLVGGGTYRLEKTRRPEAQVIPRKAKWLKEAVVQFVPDENYVLTREGTKVVYRWLVVAAGIHIHWDKIKGLSEAIGTRWVCSNYSYKTAAYTWECIRNFQGGVAIFTQPAGAIKCGGAPQKICYLAEDYFRRHGVRDKTRVIFASAGKRIFAVDKYRVVLERIIHERGIETLFRHDLIEIRADEHEAVFKNLDTEEDTVLHYDMIHVTPPQGPPPFIAESPLADAHGWVDVDPQTLQHKKFPNVFGIGDCTNLPTSKTGAAIRKQAPVLVRNLQAAMRGQPLTAKYNGYTSCPVVTRYGKLVLAEFDYEHQPAETFPFDQAKERWSMWVLKKYILPRLYWYGMLKGRA
ncbi:MAG: pyridine nucleotide-disulfide oxidoreductase [Pirellulaceae bacterium]|nr:MAG: pyridine nucleotide-disulfide oxidoreductase [Pirellulaceae bacterium]